MPRTDTISVIGGGFSFLEVDQRKVPGYKIGCNDAALLMAGGVDDAVSMDRLWSENRWNTLCLRLKGTWLRRSAVQNIDWADRERKWLRIFECDNESVKFSETPDTLNGTNTGTCALNLAYLLRPRELFLFAFDMCKPATGSPYWYPPYPWAAPTGGTSNGKYKSWAAEFNSIALAFASIGTKVINVSSVSKITCFNRVSPKDIGVGK